MFVYVLRRQNLLNLVLSTRITIHHLAETSSKNYWLILSINLLTILYVVNLDCF